jgi:hypothetical protein
MALCLNKQKDSFTYFAVTRYFALRAMIMKWVQMIASPSGNDFEICYDVGDITFWGSG